jgi:glycerol-3-phosphate dehydrogenase
MGRDFGGGLTAREVDRLVREEWAETAEDVLWRRTKLGLVLAPAAAAALAQHLQQPAR